MTTRLTRREFVHAGAATLAVAQSSTISPTMLVPAAARPLVIASANGNKFTNGGSRAAVATAFARIVDGKDVLDAVVEGVSINELDPADDSVGYGGLPNAEGVVQLDSCCMHGPLKRAGGVACLEGIRTPAAVAKMILHTTDHHLLVGKDAQRFALLNGFTVEPDLNTPHRGSCVSSGSAAPIRITTSIPTSAPRPATAPAARWCATASSIPSTSSGRSTATA